MKKSAYFRELLILRLFLRPVNFGWWTDKIRSTTKQADWQTITYSSSVRELQF